MKKSLILESLNMQNFATFSDQVIHFDRGFNSIVGETGSGKSLILDALNLIFGSRSDKKLIRKGTEFSVVEAIFNVQNDNIKDFFFDMDLPYEDDVVIKRVIYKSGKSKAYVNFQQCSIATLTDLAKRYIDLVGQFENQKLFSERYQLRLLDEYCVNTNLIGDYHEQYEKYQAKTNELTGLIEKQNNLLQHKDFVTFQLNELESLNPSIDDENDLINKKNSILDFEENSKNLDLINQIFDGDDSQPGLVNLSNKLNKLIYNLKGVSSKSIEDVENLNDIIRDLSFSLNKSSQFHEDSDINIEDIISRLDIYSKLKRKYNTDTEGLVKKKEELSKEFANLDQMDDKIEKTKREISRLSTLLFEKANELHNRREIGSKKLSNDLTRQVQALNMKGAQLIFQLNKQNSLGPSGITSLNFLAETNKGEGFFKVKDIASGGELSRILLAFKQVVSASDSVSIFLFDEIDAGMGGETAFKIGETLKKVSSKSQVIAITHLPQIAQFSDILIKVEKGIDKEKNRTFSLIDYAKGKEIKKEVTLMTPLV